MASVTLLDRRGEWSPPVTAPRRAEEQQRHQHQQQQHAHRCRVCYSTSLHIDWAQGDRVCTECGVVDDERILDDRPEWRDFGDVEDLIKTGGVSQARSGLVVVDESQYIGGLQPTKLSKHCFGGSTKTSDATRKRLVAMNHRLDQQMHRWHSQALASARMSSKIHKRQRQDESHHTDIPPELEAIVLQEEEEASRIEVALHANKWSLRRAIRLFGTPHQQEQIPCATTGQEGEATNEDMDDDVIDRNSKGIYLEASKQLHRAYSILIAASKKLNLPDIVVNEAIAVLCRYASQRNGLIVRGVSSALKLKSTATRCSPQQEKEAKQALRDYNSTKQAGSLCAALLFYVSRNMERPRSLLEVCASIEPPASSCPGSFGVGNEQFIKKKHCSKAMSEIKSIFPKLAHNISAMDGEGHDDRSRARGTQQLNAAHFTEHSIHRLRLPPVAEAAVRALVVQWTQAQEESSANLAATCAGITYFVCQAGEIMQKLASQATGVTDAQRVTKKRRGSSLESESDILESSLRGLSREQREYEMGRVWDAWSLQTPWRRSIGEIEQSCGVSHRGLVDIYLKQIHPARANLLTTLKNSVTEKQNKDNEIVPNKEIEALRDTPLACILLPEIAAVGSLLKAPN